MSNPFYGLTPVYLPFSGTTDANGNFRIVLKPRAGFWFTGKLVNEVAAGFPAVRVSDGAIPLGFGRGIRAEVAGLVAPPGAGLVVDVIAAQANTAVTGSLVGLQGPDMQSITQALVMAPNTVAVDTAQQQTVLGTIQTVGGGDTVSKTFQVPPGTQAVGFVVTFTGFGNPTQIIMTGHQTSRTYFSTGLIDGAKTREGFQITPVAVVDTSIDCSVQSGAGPSFVSFLAFTYDPTVFVQQFGLGTIDVQEGSTPPAWQAPQALAYLETAVNGTTLVAGVAGQKIRVFGWALAVDGAHFAGLRDGSIAAPGGRLVSFNGSTSLNAVAGNHSGVPLTVSAALLIDTDGVGLVRAAAGYSQAT